jgi:hypothetical protein
VCKHYKEEYGIEFKTLEPFNESTSAYWNYMGSQEGCHFEPETQMKIIRLLYSKLKNSNLKTVISAADETNLASSIRVLNKYMQAGDILDKMGQFNTHSYNGTNKERQDLKELVAQTGKDFWQSESGPMGLPRKASGLENNLLLAQKMFDDLRLMQPQAWLDWQLMEEHNDVWGLVRCNFKAENYNLLKNLYVRMQITRFIKQAYTIIETNHETVLAAKSPDDSVILIAVLNSDDVSKDYKIGLRGINVTLVISDVYRTTSNENCESIQTNKMEDDAILYAAPAFSLTTFAVQNPKK